LTASQFLCHVEWIPTHARRELRRGRRRGNDDLLDLFADRLREIDQGFAARCDGQVRRGDVPAAFQQGAGARLSCPVRRLCASEPRWYAPASLTKGTVRYRWAIRLGGIYDAFPLTSANCGSELRLVILIIGAAWATAHTFAYLRIADRVTASVARLATDPGGLTPDRVGLAPTGRHTRFRRVIAYPAPP
jgi:hypothetical protein